MTVKNFRISVGLGSNSAGVPGVAWALVYAPYGSSVNSLLLLPDLFMNHHNMLLILECGTLMQDHFVFYFNVSYTSSW